MLLDSSVRNYIDERTKKKICCLCGEPIEGFGNNPYPLKSDGRCCDSCNATKVIPERIKRWTPNTSQTNINAPESTEEKK